MTIQTLLSKVKEEKPNTFGDTRLVQFLNEIEAEVAHELSEDLTPYENVDDTVLIAPDPYSRLYVSYLKAMIDYANEEYASYQLNAEQHAQDYGDFVDWVVRENVNVESVVPSRFRNVF